MTLIYFIQPVPVTEKSIFLHFFDKDIIKQMLGLQLRTLFKCSEVTEVIRQYDKLFINLLDKFRLGNIVIM